MFLHLPRIIQAYYLHYEVFLLIVIVLMQRHTLHPCLELIYSSSKKKKKKPEIKAVVPTKAKHERLQGIISGYQDLSCKNTSPTDVHGVPNNTRQSYAFLRFLSDEDLAKNRQCGSRKVWFYSETRACRADRPQVIYCEAHLLPPRPIIKRPVSPEGGGARGGPQQSGRERGGIGVAGVEKTKRDKNTGLVQVDEAN